MGGFGFEFREPFPVRFPIERSVEEEFEEVGLFPPSFREALGKFPAAGFEGFRVIGEGPFEGFDVGFSERFGHGKFPEVFDGPFEHVGFGNMDRGVGTVVLIFIIGPLLGPFRNL